MTYEQQQNFFNGINLIALALGWENLQENRLQTAYNDVHEANDKQAEYLLGEIRAMTDELNKRLERQDEMLKKILKAIEDARNATDT